MSTTFVLGLGGTVDFELEWNPDAMARLAARHRIGLADLDPGRQVADERGLLCSLLGFLRDGAGGERFVATSEIIGEFAGQLRHRVALGGTCVRAALAMDALGLRSTVHLVSIDDTVRRLLPQTVSVLCSAEHDSLDPHLIVQFPAGTTVTLADGEVTSPRANRIIYVNDPPNRELRLAEALGDAYASADVVLLSGFNVMQDEDLLKDRLRTLKRQLARVPAHALVYFEDADYHVPGMAGLVRDALADVVDVWAMNEDELAGWIGRTVDLLDADDVADAMTALAEVVPAAVRVVHTRYWALAHGEVAGRLRAGLAGGTAMAAARYLVGDAVTAAAYTRMSEQARSAQRVRLAAQVEAALPGAACEPALDLQVETPTTVGLGDAFVGGFLAGAVS